MSIDAYFEALRKIATGWVRFFSRFSFRSSRSGPGLELHCDQQVVGQLPPEVRARLRRRDGADLPRGGHRADLGRRPLQRDHQEAGPLHPGTERGLLLPDHRHAHQQEGRGQEHARHRRHAPVSQRPNRTFSNCMSPKYRFYFLLCKIRRLTVFGSNIVKCLIEQMRTK